MKKYLRKFVIFFVIFVLLWQYFPLIYIKPGFENIIYASAVFMLLDSYLKPLLKKILFPINMLTFGLASLVIYALVIFVGDKFLNVFKVLEYTTPLFNTEFGQISPYTIVFPVNYVVVGLVMVILQRLLTWVFKKDV